MFIDDPSADDSRPRIIKWYEEGLFADKQKALDESLTCACFLGHDKVVEYLLSKGINLSAGNNTGLNGFHWAANRGQLHTVMLLINHNAPLETRNMYGGTVLGATVWAVIHEPKADHIRIIEELIKAGANLDEVDYPTGNKRVDEIISRYRPTS